MKNLVLMLVAAGFGYGVCWIQQLSPEPKTGQTADSPTPATATAPGPTDDQLTREMGRPIVKARTGSGYSFWIYPHRVIFVSSSGAVIGNTGLDPTNVPNQSFFAAPDDPTTAGSPRKEYLLTRHPNGDYQIQLLPSSAGLIDRGRFDNVPVTGPTPPTSGLRGTALDQRPRR